MSEREVGTVKWFNGEKGFGFIARKSNEKDVFVHYSSIVGEGFRVLKDGEEVKYEMIQGEKGYQARNVTQLGQGAAEGQAMA